MENEKALIYLKEMGFDDSKAREMLASPMGENYKRLLSTMEDGLRTIVGDSNIEPMKVFQKVNNGCNLLDDSRRKF